MWAIVDLKSTCLCKDVEAVVEFNHLRLGVEKRGSPSGCPRQHWGSNPGHCRQ